MMRDAIIGHTKSSEAPHKLVRPPRCGAAHTSLSGRHCRQVLSPLLTTLPHSTERERERERHGESGTAASHVTEAASPSTAACKCSPRRPLLSPQPRAMPPSYLSHRASPNAELKRANAESSCWMRTQPCGCFLLCVVGTILDRGARHHRVVAARHLLVLREARKAICV